MNFPGKTEVAALFTFKKIWESVSSLYGIDVKVLEASLYPPLLKKLYFLGNFQASIFRRIWIYEEIFKSALVYL